MYEWTEPYEDEYIKERIKELRHAQENAARNGKTLIAPYEQFWLPVLNDMPDVEYIGRQTHRAPYGTFEPAADMPFHGALWFTPTLGAELPPALKDNKDWIAAGAVVDMNARTVNIQVEDIEITFTGLNVCQSAHELLREINQELVRAKSGVYVYRIEPVVQDSAVRHLYPTGRIPTLSNAHTRADVTGFAVLQDRPYQHTLTYVGIAAHKTSVESLWASLIRGRGSCSMRGTSVVADGEVKMVTQPLADFNVLHAGLICRKALPGKWEAKDDAAYALIFEDGNVEANLQTLTLKRLQETLAFPIPDMWAKTLWEYALDAEFVQRLETGGDCRGGVRIDLTKDWQALVQNLLEKEVLKV
ncbi:MAG: hypothetical protein DPW21_00530 [Anaerolineae bacterium]|nr:hypothetical protein [Anaerolineae bacterium]MCZ7550943.1 hypothetical protein [Anaerolineales bacterium]GER79150.1 conserved hypothetical protein [Candidatus Denitrolinea symbiosum]